MLTLSHATRRVRIPRDIEHTANPIIDRLLAPTFDGACLFSAIRPLFGGERPRSEAIRGTTTRFYVEGPWYNVADISFPLGGQLWFEDAGWVNLDPVQAACLLKRGRDSFDDAAYRWAAEANLIGRATSCRRPRIRSLEDELALRQMAAAAGCAPPEGETHDA
jgi:hypothetical protein